ncbi:alpha/beta hydrolase [Mycolicibacterium baixiangningiae]|uniref:alpha/beta hydrolase n=1 Tax=Mycolicibacterium baixiangningiae TaxID=2761578 RepID=UPI00186613DD|nr:alpha/beta hydrolase [Mycolicibacterium baixiangningiae]
MTLDSQIKVLLNRVAEGGGQSPESLTVAENRAVVGALAPLGGEPEPMAAVLDCAADLDGRTVTVRIYTPTGTSAGTLPITVFFHGGGWVTGDLDSQDPMARSLAKQSRSIVVSVDYRLAPEHRFPAAVDDAYDVLTWVHTNASIFHGDRDRLVVFGESAGANLAAVTAQLAHRRGGPKILLQVLAYPAVDRFDDSPSMIQNAAGPLLTRSWLEWFWGCYLNSPDEGADPRVSPARAGDLTGLPPAIVVTAQHDPLRDQGDKYAALLRDAGVEVKHSPVKGATHGFLAFAGSVDLSRNVLSQLGEAIATAVGSSTTGSGEMSEPGVHQ